MAGHGFQLGMHGHQHVAAAAAYYVHRERSQEMAVVSAGSLCAGFRELPRGVNRQYNLVVINDDYSGARLHVREMVEGGHFTRASRQGFLQGYNEIVWQVPLDAAGRKVDVAQQNERRAIEHAERALGSGDWKAALTAIQFSTNSSRVLCSKNWNRCCFAGRRLALLESATRRGAHG